MQLNFGSSNRNNCAEMGAVLAFRKSSFFFATFINVCLLLRCLLKGSYGFRLDLWFNPPPSACHAPITGQLPLPHGCYPLTPQMCHSPDLVTAPILTLSLSPDVIPPTDVSPSPDMSPPPLCHPPRAARRWSIYLGLQRIIKNLSFFVCLFVFFLTISSFPPPEQLLARRRHLLSLKAKLLRTISYVVLFLAFYLLHRCWCMTYIINKDEGQLFFFFQFWNEHSHFPL